MVQRPRLYSPPALRRRKPRRDFCFYYLNGYAKELKKLRKRWLKLPNQLEVDELMAQTD
jgi:hypothetical protein